MVLIVQKKPRETLLPDRKPNFKPFEQAGLRLNLHLVEFGKKLRKGLPLIPVEVKKPVAKKEEFKPPPTPRQEEPPVSQARQGAPSKDTTTKEKPVKLKKKKRREEDDDYLEIDDNDLVGSLIGEKTPHRETYTSEDGEEEDLEEDIDDDEIVEEEEKDEDVEEDPYAGLTPEEREAKEREEYIWRFKILKKKFGDSNTEVKIPEYNEFSDLNAMKLTYDSTIKELYLDDAVESYRMYLIGGSMIIEFVCTQLMDVDLGGFVAHQTKVMHRYNRLLVELGEKSYNQWGSTIPVEIRLIGAILFQAGIFYLAKIVSVKYGGGAADLFRGVTGQPPPVIEDAKKEGGDEPPKKRMMGPKIKPSTIRQAVEVEDEDE